MSDGNRYQPCPKCSHPFRLHRPDYSKNLLKFDGFACINGIDAHLEQRENGTVLVTAQPTCQCRECPFDHPGAEMDEDPRR